MTTTSAAAEEILQERLRADPDRALAYLHEHFGLLIARYLKRATWGLLGAEDLKDAYQETLKGVLERARAPGFDPSRPLRLVFTIARRKGLDGLRRRGHRIETDHAALDRVTADAPLGDRLGPAEGKELREDLLRIIQALPARQRLVARVFVDHFEEFRQRDTYQPLARAVSAVTGEPEDAGAVKGVWRAARATIARELSRRGYPLPGMAPKGTEPLS